MSLQIFRKQIQSPSRSRSRLSNIKGRRQRGKSPTVARPDAPLGGGVGGDACLEGEAGAVTPETCLTAAQLHWVALGGGGD